MQMLWIIISTGFCGGDFLAFLFLERIKYQKYIYFFNLKEVQNYWSFCKFLSCFVAQASNVILLLSILKDLFRENIYFIIRFYPLRTSKIYWKYFEIKKQTSKIQSEKLSGPQLNHFGLQPTKKCHRKLKNQFF